MCYEQATNAYLREIRLSPRNFHDRVAKLQQNGRVPRASRNNIYSSRGGGSDGVIDLHGLHVAEAITVT